MTGFHIVNMVEVLSVCQHKENGQHYENRTYYERNMGIVPFRELSCQERRNRPAKKTKETVYGGRGGTFDRSGIHYRRGDECVIVPQQGSGDDNGRDD